MDWSRNPRIQRAAQLMQAGGVIAYPTEAVWGLGCDPDNPRAVARLLALKQRPWEKGLIMVAARIEQFAPLMPGQGLATTTAGDLARAGDLACAHRRAGAGLDLRPLRVGSPAGDRSSGGGGAQSRFRGAHCLDLRQPGRRPTCAYRASGPPVFSRGGRRHRPGSGWPPKPTFANPGSADRKDCALSAVFGPQDLHTYSIPRLTSPVLCFAAVSGSVERLSRRAGPT